MADEESTVPEIDMREDGPLLAKHIPALILADGTVAEPRPLAPLCRCGASSNKPYCDGSHRDTNYKSASEPDTEKNRSRAYTGAAVTVHYNKLLCSHAGECTRRAGEVFDTSKRPWIDPDRGQADAIREAVQACPSGALRISENGGDPHHLADDHSTVMVEKNGPYRVSNLPLAADMWMDGASPKKYVLCRCGKSSNTPFCDGSHVDENWSDGS